MKKRTINGEVCCTVADAAKYLGTNAKKVRELLGQGKIEQGPQPRSNCRTLYLRADSVARVKYDE